MKIQFNLCDICAQTDKITASKYRLKTGERITLQLCANHKTFRVNGDMEKLLEIVAKADALANKLQTAGRITI